MVGKGGDGRSWEGQMVVSEGGRAGGPGGRGCGTGG